MNKKDKKRTLNSRFLFTSLICAILFLISGLWVLLIPLLPVLLGLGIRLLLLSKRNVNTDQTKEAPSSPAPQPAPLDENDSFGHIQLRIAELVRHQFPKARWVWENPNARFDIENGAPLFIRLNRAGGFRRATVILNGDDVDDLSFCVTETPPTDTENDTPEEDEEELPPPPRENYELMAFEWVDANILWLNDLMNEAIARSESTLLIPSESLPVVPCWPALCSELERRHSLKSVIVEDGIKVELPTQ